MNLNNLEDLKGEMKTLGFSEKLSAQMEQNMEKEFSDFQLHDSLPGNKGQVDVALHFKQSNQSDYYYMNKYEVVLNKAKPLEDGHQYMVISPAADDKTRVKKFDSPYPAMDFFKQQNRECELAAGKDVGHKTPLVTMAEGKVNFVAKEFRNIYYAPKVDQTFFVDRGAGFTVEQAANLIQGRSVYKDDLLNRGGEPYKAWVKLDMDKPKDRHGNFVTNQYHDPSYGFNLESTLEKYRIKELEDPAKKEKVIGALKNGSRPLITTEKDGEVVKLHVEAVPRYSQVNFYRENGKPEKREQFEKAAEKEQSVGAGKGRSKAAVKEENQGMAM
jgi:hypothetical protein